MREITDHHDGHGLNESIELFADALDTNGGGASHRYEAEINGQRVLTLNFQQGPRNEEGSRSGVTEASLLAIVADRLRSFQAGPFSSRENALALTKVEEAMLWMKARADARAKRGVLGKNIK